MSRQVLGVECFPAQNKICQFQKHLFAGINLDIFKWGDFMEVIYLFWGWRIVRMRFATYFEKVN